MPSSCTRIQNRLRRKGAEIRQHLQYKRVGQLTSRHALWQRKRPTVFPSVLPNVRVSECVECRPCVLVRQTVNISYKTTVYKTNRKRVRTRSPPARTYSMPATGRTTVRSPYATAAETDLSHPQSFCAMSGYLNTRIYPLPPAAPSRSKPPAPRIKPSPAGKMRPTPAIQTGQTTDWSPCATPAATGLPRSQSLCPMCEHRNASNAVPVYSYAKTSAPHILAFKSVRTSYKNRIFKTVSVASRREWIQRPQYKRNGQLTACHLLRQVKRTCRTLNRPAQ